MIRNKLPQLVAVTAVVLTLPAAAHEGHTEAIEEVVVYGRAQPQVGIATVGLGGLRRL